MFGLPDITVIAIGSVVVVIIIALLYWDLTFNPELSAPQVPEACGAGWRFTISRSGMMKTLQSCSPPQARARSVHITSLFSGVSCWQDDTPGLSRCSGTSGCKRPLLAERSRGMLVAGDREYARPVRLRKRLTLHE